MEGQKCGIWYKSNYKLINIYICIFLYSMRNNEKNIENKMMEWKMTKEW